MWKKPVLPLLLHHYTHLDFPSSRPFDVRAAYPLEMSATDLLSIKALFWLITQRVYFTNRTFGITYLLKNIKSMCYKKYRIVCSLLLQRVCCSNDPFLFQCIFRVQQFQNAVISTFFSLGVAIFKTSLCEGRWVTLLLHLFGEIEIYPLMSFIAVLFCGQCPLPPCEIKCILDFENLPYFPNSQ